jgi:hypothetical protein
MIGFALLFRKKVATTQATDSNSENTRKIQEIISSVHYGLSHSLLPPKFGAIKKLSSVRKDRDYFSHYREKVTEFSKV